MIIENTRKYLKNHDLTTNMERGYLCLWLKRRNPEHKDDRWYIRSHAYIDENGENPFKGEFILKLKMPKILHVADIDIFELAILRANETRSKRLARRQRKRTIAFMNTMRKKMNTCACQNTTGPTGVERVKQMKECLISHKCKE